jgi:hypothetical protein
MSSQGLWTALQQATQAKRQHVGDLLHRKNVVACGVGFKESEGQISTEPCIVVSVTHKVPQAQLAPEDLVPRSLDSVKTDVQEVGVFHAWQGGPKDRHRPAIAGISCGHPDVSAGTFGCLVSRGAERFILSNNHVLANINKANRGDPILQPARYDGGTINDQIAILEDYVPLSFGATASSCSMANSTVSVLNGIASVLRSDSRFTALSQNTNENKVDCAIARPLRPDLVRPTILQIGPPTGEAVGTLGMQVQKTGRTTGYTTGQINQLEVTVKVDYHGQDVIFVGQMMASGMSGGGDSGSAVLDMQRQAVGLLFAGSDRATLINPIQEVLRALDVQLVTG